MVAKHGLVAANENLGYYHTKQSFVEHTNDNISKVCHYVCPLELLDLLKRKIHHTTLKVMM